jgi:hypothetical protein
MPPKGEALVNPFYAAQRFAETLGATTTWDRMLTAARTDAVIVVVELALEPEPVRARRAAASGSKPAGGSSWTTAARSRRTIRELVGHRPAIPDPENVKDWKQETTPLCRRRGRSSRAGPSADASLWLCDLGMSWLESRQTPSWALRDAKGLQAVRVPLGRAASR